MRTTKAKATKPARKKPGRKPIEIDQGTFEGLCEIMCTLDEVAFFFKCSPDTIERWCKRTYKDKDGKGRTFKDVSVEFQSISKISLRRTQFALAKKSTAMSIFLGKIYLGQKETQSVELTGKDGEPVEVENTVKIYLPDNGRDGDK